MCVRWRTRDLARKVRRRRGERVRGEEAEAEETGRLKKDGWRKGLRRTSEGEIGAGREGVAELER